VRAEGRLRVLLALWATLGGETSPVHRRGWWGWRSEPSTSLLLLHRHPLLLLLLLKSSLGGTTVKHLRPVARWPSPAWTLRLAVAGVRRPKGLLAAHEAQAVVDPSLWGVVAPAVRGRPVAKPTTPSASAPTVRETRPLHSLPDKDVRC